LKALSGMKAVLVVGHEPHLSAWIAELVSGGRMQCLMKKGSVACVELEGLPPVAGSGVLRWLMTAKHLALVSGIK
jgi:phosphohistidine phosphatase SixA